MPDAPMLSEMVGQPVLSQMLGHLGGHTSVGVGGGFLGDAAGGQSATGICSGLDAGAGEPLGASGVTREQMQSMLAAFQAAVSGNPTLQSSIAATFLQNGNGQQWEESDEDSDAEAGARGTHNGSNVAMVGAGTSSPKPGGNSIELPKSSVPREKMDFKKAKKGVYAALKEFVDQNLEEPADERMKHIIKGLRTVQRDEKPAGWDKDWVGCDSCLKWRKIPRGFKFDPDKSFFCNMMPKITCDTKEEHWEENNKDASFITAEWVLFSWSRMKAELMKERQKFEDAVRLAQTVNGQRAQPDVAAHELAAQSADGPVSEEQAAASAAAAAAAAAEKAAATARADKAAQWVRSQMECLSKWQVDDNVEAKDSSSKWYRSTVRAVSFSQRQVLINFGGWDQKWDEWVRVKDRRIRDIQCPEAPKIKTDGTPLWPKSKKKDDMMEEMEDMEMEEVEAVPIVPAKLTREEQRNLDRLRRLDEEEQRRIKKEKRELTGPSPKQVFVLEETERLMKEDKTLKKADAMKLARDEWKKRTGVEPEMPMGFVIGSVHQLYACLDEETVAMVAEKLKLDVDKLLSMNKAVYPDMKMNDKLMEGTLLKLPLREGSGDSKREIKVLCKVQAVKNILTFTMKETEPIKALKRRVYGKEDIPVKQQTVIFANQRLDDERTLADYNISDEALVIIQVGHIETLQTNSDAIETEYDSKWMLSAAGSRFMETKEGQAWLKTKSGLEWQKQKKQDDREKIKEKKSEQSQKLREERGDAQPTSLQKYTVWLKAEVEKLRNFHPRLTYKELSDKARWTWKVYAGPSTYKHRAMYAKMPSVVTWNSHNISSKPETETADAEGGEEETVAGKKRRDVIASDELNTMIKSNAFSTSYDWSYRENHLSRTAKKAARISLTTDTIEMMTCGLEGLDDRYDGSGWTTWKSKDAAEGKKKKFNKDGTERKPRQTQSRQPKAAVDPLALPKEKGGNIPRWFKGMPHCPDLLLPKDENVHLRPLDATKPVDAVQQVSSVTEVAQVNEKVQIASEATSESQQPATDTAAGKDSSHDAFFSTLSERERKRQMAIMQKLTKEGGSNESAAKGDPSKKNNDAAASEPFLSGHEAEGYGHSDAVEKKPNPASPVDLQRNDQQATDLEMSENPEQVTVTKVTVGSEEDAALVPAAMEGDNIVKNEKGSETVATSSVSDVQTSLLPLPTSAQLEQMSQGGQSIFQLPYLAACYKFQREFDDYVCGDDKSEFPTPFVPINKNEYVDEDNACKLPMTENKHICQCIYVPGTPETACGEQSNCLLRDIYIECGDRCPSGSRCLNKRLRKRQWAKCSIFLASNGRGWALRNDVPLVTGQLVMEYIGEVITGDEVDKRMEEYKGKRHTYLLKLNHEEFIDSTRKSNLARFINHCCEPNCVMQKWNVGGVQRVGLFAKYPIPEGSELTFDYDMEFYGSEGVKCLCGAPQCRGTLGKKEEGEKAKSGAAARKSGEGVSQKNGKKHAEDTAKASSADKARAAHKADANAGGKRKQQGDAKAGEENDFFNDLSPRERKRQLRMMLKLEKESAKVDT